jgi:hypothetical protein
MSSSCASTIVGGEFFLRWSGLTTVSFLCAQHTDSHDEGREGVYGLHVHNFLVLEVLTQHAQFIELCSSFNLVVA